MADEEASVPQESRVPEDWAPETCLRLYDEAMLDWLKTLTYRGTSPTVKTGWGSRFFEEVSEIHGKENLGPKQGIPLPMVALLSPSIAPDHTRWTRSDVRAVKGGPTSTENTIYHGNDRSAVLHLPAPQPIDVTYQVEIMAKTRQDLRFLITNLLGRFRNSPVELFLRVRIPDPWGEKIIPLRLERADDTSDLEAGERERVLRYTVTFVLKGWIFKAPILRKTILKAHIALIEGDPNDADLRAHYGDAANYNFNADKTVLESVTESPDFSPPDRVIATMSFTEGTLTAVDGATV